MVIPRAAIRRYAEKLSQLTSKADEAVRVRVEAYMAENPAATVEELRNFTIVTIDEVVSSYGDAASVAATSLYDEIMSAEDVMTDAAKLYAGPNKDAIERGVRYQARWLKEDERNPERFVNEVRELTRYHVRKAANDTTIDNVERANAQYMARQRKQKRAIATGRSGRAGKVRYGRIPTGLETCTFCTMLASRGFVYSSAESAGHADHRGCNCLIIPGIKDQTEVDGYDPDTLYRLWQDFLEIDGKAIHGEEGEILTGVAEERAVQAMKAEALRARLGRDTFDAD